MVAFWIYCQQEGKVVVLSDYNFKFLCLKNVVVLIYQELQEHVAEQRRLLQSVANVGEELLSQQTTPNGDRYSSFSCSLSYATHSCDLHFLTPKYRTFVHSIFIFIGKNKLKYAH